MGGNGNRRRVQEILALADIRINGDRPWDLHVHNSDFFRRVLTQGALGLGESYMEGWWDCDSLDEFFVRALRAGLENKVPRSASVVASLKARVFNPQSRRRSFRVGEHHYDIGNDLFRYMLDDLMIYSCGYWKEAASLEDAQVEKLDLICRKLRLEPGMRILDVGCGWGGTAKFAAERYQVEVVGVSVSLEQVRTAREACRGLPVSIHLQDYRSVRGSFDRILSVGMFEHVGSKNHRTYMRKMAELLREQGLFLLQTIGSNRTVASINTWIDRYIFPNGAIPSARQITSAIEGLFVLEDWHSFGSDYDRTLMCWYHNFNESWHLLRDRYGDSFYRMWKYFLLSSAAGFRARRDQLWQIVLSRKGIPGGYPVLR
ncbi:MAG: cyclopropane fatty acyl phospholipid synthase [bacterium]|nr:MAG: cyclopropane fatty acyl phospholipid synthase [bacterium]